MKALIKVLNWIAWISAGIGTFIILYGTVHVLFGWAIYPVNNSASFFLAANSFYLLTIALFLFILTYQFKKQ